MPTMMIVDSNPSTLANVQRALAGYGEQWTLLVERDPVAALEQLARRQSTGSPIDAVLVGWSLTELDGEECCLLIRDLWPALAVAPVAMSTTDAPWDITFVQEVGCAPVVLMEGAADIIRSQLAALVRTELTRLPSTGVLPHALRKAHIAWRRARDQRALPVVLFATSPITRFSMRHFLDAAGVRVIAESATLPALQHDLHATRSTVMVSDAADALRTAEVARCHKLPRLLVASTVFDGVLVTPDQTQGIITADDAANPIVLTEALLAVAGGDIWISSALKAPFRGTDLTSQEQAILVLELQGYHSKDIADRLGVAHRTITHYRTAMSEKLSIRPHELARHARIMLQSH